MANFKETSPSFVALDPQEHGCETCDNDGNEPIIGIHGPDSRSFVCARCLKGALGLLRGLGLTS